MLAEADAGGMARGNPNLTQHEVHARTHPGEVVVHPDVLASFLDHEDLHPPHPEFAGRGADIEVRTASPGENPPNGAVWLTAVDGKISLKADPVEVLRVLHEGGILDALREQGKLDFL